ncbi:Macpf domain-containing protein [Thalictrum thalictroides]|uniref:Macpf domain-containing protein n=1 Tax=Thalictrum thalictroides TaxID=46969 RepID=A0A7J6X962_THATH|nr:Macpf domain-containing protein [Thalictrum thalictroides]
MNSYQLNPQTAAKTAVSVIGYGYDLCSDIRLIYCKPGPKGSPLIELDQSRTHNLGFPGGIVVPNVSKSITSDKGERTRFGSDVVSFHQMSEQFNHDLSLTGKIPSGLFNSMFNFQNCWQKDATSVKSLAYDGWFITLYNIALARSQIVLREHVKKEVPSSWDPASLAKFIETYGTHIIIGVKMGGKDVIHVKQLYESNIQPSEVQKWLKHLADGRFPEDANGSISMNASEFSQKAKDEKVIALERDGPLSNSVRPIVFHSKKEDIVSVHVRRGGINRGQSHNQWLSTISDSPDVISMSFVPITSLLSGVQGGGFLTHAVNLYLRYKPPIEELHQFLEFQLPRQWAPMYGDFPLGPQSKKNSSPSLQFTFTGPKLYVNTVQVDSKNRPVTGMRLYLEGKKNDHLAIHLQHLTTLPKIIQPSDYCGYEVNEDIPSERGYYEPVKWSILSHVCTAPVQYNGSRIDDFASIVTKAWFEVKDIGIRKVLFLRLGFSTLSTAKVRRSHWDGPAIQSRKSGSISMLFSTRFSSGQPQPEKPSKVEVNSAVYPGGPPMPTKMPRLSKFIDTKEMVRGPDDTPGHWVVTGGKLCIEDNKISLKVKYSLLLVNIEEEIY